MILQKRKHVVEAVHLNRAALENGLAREFWPLLSYSCTVAVSNGLQIE
jgi:hypothetical protein